ncbi:MAG: cellulase family glycosylhydrolase [Deinococcota bacterium]
MTSSLPASPKLIVTDGLSFKDAKQRTVILRGVNLGGNSKSPQGHGGHIREDFFNHRDVSFVGKPVPLDDADVHFARLRAWGVRLLRLVITWEAVEHAGPGQYDTAFLEYLQTLVAKAGDYGLMVIVDPHQDVWSRFSGGDGAPSWTLELAGFNMQNFAETGAATVQQTHRGTFPKMIWLTNYSKLATATMFTLFFAGRNFAPKTQVNGKSLQDVLQTHYINAFCQVAERLKTMPHVLGYGTLNEPSSGYIGLADIHKRVNAELLVGAMPTAFEGMYLGAGVAQSVDQWKLGVLGPHKQGKQVMNADGVSAWLEPHLDIWQQHGVWELTEAGPMLQQPDYFASVNGHKVDFFRDYFRPFANRYAHAIRQIDPHALIFVEGLPGEESIHWLPEDAPNIVHAPHWYDVATLISKRFWRWLSFDIETSGIVFGPGRVRGMFARQIAKILRVSKEAMLGAPTLVGEVGIPFDMHPKAFKDGNFAPQVRAMNASLRSLERHMVSYTLWNYNPDNTNAHGDDWNGEDLSIFSRDQQTQSESLNFTEPLNPEQLTQEHLDALNDGGRALEAVIRPYAYKVTGTPTGMAFYPKRKLFRFRFRSDPNPTPNTPCEFFIPRYQYPNGFKVIVSDGDIEIFEGAQKVLYYPSLNEREHTVVVLPKDATVKDGVGFEMGELEP